MNSGLRKLVRTGHIVFTVGWLGAVAGFFALAVTGLNSRDVQTVRAVYFAMKLITWSVILPFSFIPLLLTGPLLSLGTPWGLFRHYWIITKLVINILSVLVLVLHLQPINYLARAATESTLSSADHSLQLQMVIASGAALGAILAATALAVYKPRGVTPYGWRKQYEERASSQT